jgi:predicted nuclease of predicted toxin-antitoxin system
MQILFDQGTPVPLRRFLPDHWVETAYEKGWNDIQNGELLARAETEGFEVLITTDQNLRYQQNLTGRSISIVVLMTTSWPRIKLQAETIKQIV